jgi:hypothetical protein
MVSLVYLVCLVYMVNSVERKNKKHSKDAVEGDVEEAVGVERGNICHHRGIGQ